MTKEELKKEAELFVSEKWTPYDFYDVECNVYNDDIKEDLIETYVASAEPREKRIAELEDTNKKISIECHKLVDSLEKMQNKNVELIGKVAFLENDLNNAKAQIEKMECCGNCVHFDFTEPNYCHKGVYRANQKVCGEWCFGN